MEHVYAERALTTKEKNNIKSVDKTVQFVKNTEELQKYNEPSLCNLMI